MFAVGTGEYEASVRVDLEVPASFVLEVVPFLGYRQQIFEVGGAVAGAVEGNVVDLAFVEWSYAV